MSIRWLSYDDLLEHWDRKLYCKGELVYFVRYNRLPVHPSPGGRPLSKKQLLEWSFPESISSCYFNASEVTEFESQLSELPGKDRWVDSGWLKHRWKVDGPTLV